MEIKIKFDDTKLKKIYGDFFKKVNSSGNHFEAFSRLNMDLYNKFYENMPQNILAYYKLFNEMFEKYLDIIRGIMLKGVGIAFLWDDVLALCLFTVIILTVAVLRFRKSLD